MKIYDDKGNIIESPNLENGRIYRKYLLNGEVVNVYQPFTDEDRQTEYYPTIEERVKEIEEALTALLEGATE